MMMKNSKLFIIELGRNAIFTEVMLIKNGHDLDEFMEMYDLSAVSKEY